MKIKWKVFITVLGTSQIRNISVIVVVAAAAIVQASHLLEASH